MCFVCWCIKNFYSFIDPCFTALVPAALVPAALVPAALVPAALVPAPFLFAAFYIKSWKTQNNT